MRYEPIFIVMASSSDYSVIHEKYQEEGLPKGISIVRYCEMQGVPYKGYERWYKRERHAAVYSVDVVGSRKLMRKYGLDSKPVLPSSPTAPSPAPSRGVLFSIEIKASSGLSLQHSDISYQELRALVGKLEALC